MEEDSTLIGNKKRELDFIKFKKFFLLEFTRQLIRNSAPSEIFTLQTLLEKEREQRLKKTREKVKEIFEERKKEIPEDQEKNLSTSAREIKGKTREIPSIMHAAIGMFRNQEIPHLNPFREPTFLREPQVQQSQQRPARFNPPERIRLVIPESKFPVHLQYIKPVPMNKEIELGKINPLINDSNVKVIECYGPGENLIVQGNMGVKRTAIILDKEEIDNTIQRFSRETKIPIQEGIFKVAAGRLIFLAIISEIVGSKFIIKKMLYESPQSAPMYGM
jgi:hypothetical protein